MRRLAQSTAYDILVLMTDSVDHITGKAGLTLTITLSKGAAAFAGIAPTVVERGSGYYAVSLVSGNTDTLGDGALHITAAGADPTDIMFQVGPAPANLQQIDGLATNGNNATLNLKQLNIVNNAGDALVASSTGGNGDGINASGNGTGHGISLAAGATGNALKATTTAGDGFSITPTSGHALVLTGSGANKHGIFTSGGSNGAGIRSASGPGNGDGISASGNGTGHGISLAAGATGNALKATTTAGDGFSITPTSGHALVLTGNGTAKNAMLLTGAAASGVNAGGHALVLAGGASSATAGGTGGNALKADGGAGSAANNGAAAAVIITGGGTNTVTSAAHALQLIGTSTGDGLSATGGAGAGGDGISAIAGGGVDLRANITGNITGTLATVTTLTNLPAITANWLTAAGMDATAGAEIADAVWDEAIAGHLGAGSTGLALNSAGAAGDPWTIALPGAYAAGTAGAILGGTLPVNVTQVNGLAVDGTGSDADPWGPV